MRKVLLILPVVFLLAAGCNSKTNMESSTDGEPTIRSSSKVDLMLNDLDLSVSREEKSSIRSDADLTNSDSTIIIKGSEEVSNASQE